jgi:cystathionine gamma-lyase
MDERSYEPATEAIHTGEGTDDLASEAGDVVSPIHLATHHEMAYPGEPGHGYNYSRLGNPTRDALETRLARLSGAERATAFSSGTAAVATAALALVEPGDHVVTFDALYGGTRVLFDDLLADDLGVDVEYVDATDPEKVAAAMRPDTALVWMETPTNPLLKLCDLREIAGVVGEHDAVLGVDNTFATPCFQRPLDLGTDFVVHSTTKYLNGHSDSTGGYVATDDGVLGDRIATYNEYLLGNLLAPFDAYLVLRGTKTLPLRMERHERNALRVAEFLADHPAVRTVNYPGLDAHPQHGLAASQMDGFGGVVSFELDATGAETKAVLAELDVFTVAVSLGGVESLIEHPWSMSASYLSAEDRRAAGVSESLVRAPVGVEAPEDLLADLDRALANL